ncbi:hypothetical protein [Aureivirga sp. CE67]|uniref:hypothetical protein n=1 Tax=Aureivirga sp. CE67 TaxID=1788983 RepID=UPI0018CBB29F|nr:hypothetical protein [Aureivirga sp. CE67]
MKIKYNLLALSTLLLFACNNKSEKKEIKENTAKEQKFDKSKFLTSYTKDLPRIINSQKFIIEKNKDSKEEISEKDSLFVVHFLDKNAFKYEQSTPLKVYYIQEIDSILSTLFIFKNRIEIANFNKNNFEKIDHISSFNEIVFSDSSIHAKEVDTSNDDKTTETTYNLKVGKDGNFIWKGKKEETFFTDEFMRKLKPVFNEKIKKTETLNLPLSFRKDKNDFGKLSAISGITSSEIPLTKNDSIFFTEFINSYTFDSDAQGIFYDVKKVYENENFIGFLDYSDGSGGSGFELIMINKNNLSITDKISVQYETEEGNFSTGKISENFEIEIHEEIIEKLPSEENDPMIYKIMNKKFELDAKGKFKETFYEESLEERLLE